MVPRRPREKSCSVISRPFARTTSGETDRSRYAQGDALEEPSLERLYSRKACRVGYKSVEFLKPAQLGAVANECDFAVGSRRYRHGVPRKEALAALQSPLRLVLGSVVDGHLGVDI